MGELLSIEATETLLTYRSFDPVGGIRTYCSDRVESFDQCASHMIEDCFGIRAWPMAHGLGKLYYSEFRLLGAVDLVPHKVDLTGITLRWRTQIPSVTEVRPGALG